MPDVPRFATGGKVSFAPVGTSLDDKSAWTELPVRDCSYSFSEWGESNLQPYTSAIDQMVARMAREEYGNFRRRWATGGHPQAFKRNVKDSIINERSKPVGLTKRHEYIDSDGDKVTASYAVPAGATACLQVEDCDTACAYVSKTDSVALALNVLGYDRPGTAQSSFVAEVGNYTAGQATPGGQHSRDALLAEAIAKLQAVDSFDQREVERKEFEAKAAAKRDAEYAKHKQDSFDRAKQAYADAIRDQIAVGINADSAAKVQAALSAYNTARRKLEGLPG